MEHVLPICMVQCRVKIAGLCPPASLVTACPEKVMTLDWQLSAVEADPEGAGWHIFICTKLTVGNSCSGSSTPQSHLAKTSSPLFKKRLCDLQVSTSSCMVFPCALTMFASYSPFKNAPFCSPHLSLKEGYNGSNFCSKISNHFVFLSP